MKKSEAKKSHRMATHCCPIEYIVCV